MMGYDANDEQEEIRADYENMMSRFRAHPNEGRELVSQVRGIFVPNKKKNSSYLHIILQADETGGERITSVRTHIWQYFVDDGVDGKSTNWCDHASLGIICFLR